MGKPEDRAVAPGTQPVRVDNIKEESWVNTSNKAGPIGQIFFATNVTTLDKSDMDQLDIIVKDYLVDMRLNPTFTYMFSFSGYADRRDTVAHNQKLSDDRAASVEQYLYGYFATVPNYKADVHGWGVDNSRHDKSSDSKTLAPYRRVDIVAPPLLGVPVEPPPPPPLPAKQPIRSQNWQARMKSSSSASAAVFTGDRFFMDIVDLDHKLIQEFRYLGVGFGKSPATVGGSYSSSPTKWVTFTTNKPVELAEFEGTAFHTNVQVQMVLMPGATFDLVILTLAHSRRTPDWVYLKFWGFSIMDPNAGIGASETVGALQPTVEYGLPRSWLPSDP